MIQECDLYLDKFARRYKIESNELKIKNLSKSNFCYNYEKKLGSRSYYHNLNLAHKRVLTQNYESDFKMFLTAFLVFSITSLTCFGVSRLNL